MIMLSNGEGFICGLEWKCLLKMMKPTVETILMVFNKVSRKRQIKHYGEWFAGGDLDYFGQSSYPIACISFFQTCLLGSL